VIKARGTDARLPGRDLTPAPADATAGECVQGGGIIIEVDGTGWQAFIKRCVGGTHDGEVIP
jgi:hypothetical protein